jgi:GNAT superfamily N-acetyltransferase
VITYRILVENELDRIREIDRTERVRIGYRIEAGKLVREVVSWDVPNWSDGTPEHSHERIITAVNATLAAGGTAFGAFDGKRLVGLSTYRPWLTETTAQLGQLHVSRSHRRRGIASALLDAVIDLAVRDGARALYVSATPSESAIGFYLAHGFALADKPHPRLYALEPEDIHLIRLLP